jgi:hypothetical protein
MRMHLSVAGVLIGACLLAAPASAAPLGGAVSKDLVSQAQSGDNSLVIQVQRRWRGGCRGGWGGGDGGAVAAGILGAAVLGTIIATEAQRNQGVEYCMRRYRSYDPGSMTYVGRDGLRHRCP